MTRQQQDKLWNDLSEETQAAYREKYQRSLSDSKNYVMGDDWDKDIVRSQTIVAELRNLFGSHNLNSQIKVTYDTILSDFKEVGKYMVIPAHFRYTSRKQFEKVEAITKLLNVATWLNGYWKAEFISGEEKWGLAVDPCDGSVYSFEISDMRDNSLIVYFRTKELAEQAIQILGEETIKLALSTDY